MKYPIGFKGNVTVAKEQYEVKDVILTDVAPKKSVVQVYFKENNMTFAYFNDMFDLKVGDMVFVEGKFEGLRGRVVSVNYSFKIKLSDYKKVISVISTDVRGEMYLTGSHIYSFNPNVMPYEQIASWFIPPIAETEEYETGNDEDGFSIDNLSEFDITSEKAEKGNDYYMQNKVVYLCVENSHGRAIVEGSEVYEVEFDINNRIITNLICSCYCTDNCKHEFATMLQLRECLDEIERKYSNLCEGYFSALSKEKFIRFVIGNKAEGKLTLE